MVQFEVHSVETAPGPSQELLVQVRKKIGFVPSMMGVLAASPAALKAYVGLDEAYESSSLTPTERQVVLLTVSFENECHYCMAAHSVVARMQHMQESVLEALREGSRLPDSKLESLRVFTQQVVRKRGWISRDEIEAFLQAGYTKATVLEVLVGVTLKTLSNYANHIAHTPVDAAFRSQAWSPPRSHAA